MDPSIFDRILANIKENPPPAPHHLFPQPLAEFLRYNPQPCWYPLPFPSQPIRAYYEAHKAAWQGWRARPNGYEEANRVSRAYIEAGEALRRALPFETCPGHAYAGHATTATNTGGNHIVLLEPIHVGRIQREKHDALCKDRFKFWGLDPQPGGGPLEWANCITCLTIAERMLTKHMKENRHG